MDWMRTLLNRILSIFRSRKLDADLDEELKAHIDLAIAENMQRGMKAEEARTAALRAFGGVAQIRETYRVQRGLPWLEIAARNVRITIRQLRRSPGFAITAISRWHWVSAQSHLSSRLSTRSCSGRTPFAIRIV